MNPMGTVENNVKPEASYPVKHHIIIKIKTISNQIVHLPPSHF